MGQNETKEVAVQERSKSSSTPEYIPIELFLYTTKDDKLVMWIMDNIGVLRSMFKITQLSANKDTRLTLKDHVYVFSFSSSTEEEKKWHLESSLTIVGQEHNGNVCIFHFLDGTAVLILNNILYYLHFEECPDDLFDEMKKEQPIIVRKKVEKCPVTNDDIRKCTGNKEVSSSEEESRSLVINDEEEGTVSNEVEPKITGRWSNLIEKVEPELRKRVVTSKK